MYTHTHMPFSQLRRKWSNGTGMGGGLTQAGEWRAGPCGINRLTHEKTRRKQAVCGLITAPLLVINTFLIKHIEMACH